MRFLCEFKGELFAQLVAERLEKKLCLKICKNIVLVEPHFTSFDAASRNSILFNNLFFLFAEEKKCNSYSTGREHNKLNLRMSDKTGKLKNTTKTVTTAYAPNAFTSVQRFSAPAFVRLDTLDTLEPHNHPNNLL